MANDPKSHSKFSTRDSTELAAGYSSSFRILEIISVIAFLALAIFHLGTMVGIAKTNPLAVGFFFFLGILGADFVSGFVHWAADTWGSPEWPIVGQSFIRTFREHHVDQKSITRHDFIEVNGSNCMVSLPIMIGCYFLKDFYESMTANNSWLLGLYLFSVSLCIWVFLTNQFHKWAHHDSPPKYVRILQNSKLILPPEHHAIHHVAPHLSHYCITTGWLNPLLGRIRFFRILERMITAVTGALPREDDKRWSPPFGSAGASKTDLP